MEKEQLLSPKSVYLLGINSIIGSGIFLLAGKIYQDAGVFSLLAILFAGLCLTLIAFSYSNMSKIYSENGGAFVYVKNTFGRFPGYIIGMVTWILGTVSLATEVSALLTALKMLIPNLNVKSIGVIIIVLLGIVSYFSASILAKLDNVTSVIKIGFVVIFIVSCVWLVRGVNFTQVVLPSTNAKGGFLAAFGTIFFFFNGISFLPVNAQKMENPAKNLPKVMLRVMATCVSIYLIIHAVTIGVLGNHLPNTLVPAASAFSKIVGSIGIPIIVVSICISILGVIITLTFNTPTILASLAQAHEDVPMIVAKNNKHEVPTLALVFTIIGAIILFLSGSFVFLSGLTVFMSFVQYISTGLSNMKHKFLLVGIGTCVFSLVLLFSFTMEILIFGFSILFFLAFVYLFVKEKDKLEKK
ncbi:MAG: APC family permease [Streptococcaceae bacterium]|jgi:amino acid transporter|nr:APC family permease [Streptococcaceae bacterium]